MEKDYKKWHSKKELINSVAILSQIRLIDARRLAYIAGEIGKEDFMGLIKKLKALLP